MKLRNVAIGVGLGIGAILLLSRERTAREPPPGTAIPYIPMTPAEEAAISRIMDYRSLIWREAYRHRVEPAVIAAIIMQESKGIANVVSYEWNVDDKSYGLMQVRFDTARWLHDSRIVSGLPPTHERLLLPDFNLLYGVAYLSNRLVKYGDVTDAISAYNCGTIERDSRGKYSNQEYVNKVTKWIDLFRQMFRSYYVEYDLTFPQLGAFWRI